MIVYAVCENDYDMRPPISIHLTREGAERKKQELIKEGQLPYPSGVPRLFPKNETDFFIEEYEVEN